MEKFLRYPALLTGEPNQFALLVSHHMRARQVRKTYGVS
jgi:hypothetical protein